MKNEFLKLLWTLRFEKMKQTEEEAAWCYQEILDHCMKLFGPKDETVKLLDRLVTEERGHARLAADLQKICHETHPEIGV